MIIDVAKLLGPVSEADPGGIDIRDTEDYEEIAAEIEKLSNPTGSGQVDWQKIEVLGSRLFISQGKDFMVAAWVAIAWTMRYGIEGLGAGLLLQEGLISRYWETAQPSLKRIRGRRNALSWWTERTGDWLESRDVPPLRQETHSSIVQAAESLDALLAQLDPDSEPLGPFVQRIRQLAVDLPEISQPVDGSTPAIDPASESVAQQHADRADSEALSEPESQAPSKPATAIRTYMPESEQLPTDTDALVEALTPALNHIGILASALRAYDRFNPLSIEMVRFAARSSLVEAPPSREGLTALNPPAIAITDAFTTITRSGNAEGLIEFCESRIAMHPCWLDLDHEAARGFGMLGEQGRVMQVAIEQSILSFIKRLPGIEHLAFSDGMPFADASTLQWLVDCRQENTGAEKTPVSRLQHAQQQACAALAVARRADAIGVYQELIESTWSARERFQARLQLAELMLDSNHCSDPLSLVDHLVKECKGRKLADWEPELALQAWHLYLRAAEKALASVDPEDEDQFESASKAYRKARQALAAINPINII